MGWQDLLEKDDEQIVLPWLGGQVLFGVGGRRWDLQRPFPAEQGWYWFRIRSKKAFFLDKTDPPADILLSTPVRGYLVGDRIVPDGVRVDPDPKRIAEQTNPVYLVEPGLSRFVRVLAAHTDDGALVYLSEDMPLGPEADVLQAYYKKATSVAHIKGVTPALDAVFRMETYQREEAERRRQEIERQRKEDEERRQQETRRQQLARQLGDGRGRREMALVDFRQAARAALVVGGAEYLDHRPSVRKGEFVVTFRQQRRTFECVCSDTLQIVDAGICLINHATGERGDTRFTLESLPGVIRQAIHEGKLVVFRHVGDDEDND